jgi:hypothetical protein
MTEPSKKPKKPRWQFDPRAENYNGLVNIANVRCPCGGIFCDVTVGLVERMGVKHYQCDRCRERRGVRFAALDSNT